VLVAAHKRLDELSGVLRLRAVPPRAANLLQLTGLADLVTVEPPSERNVG